MCFNCALSSVYPYGDPRRIFGQGTPTEVLRLTIETRAVVGAPSDDHITEGISGWKRVCDKIIEAKGTDHAVRCVTDLIDHMILETQKLYKSTDMKDRCMLFHDALAQ
jgi:hypothetical protein